MACEECCETVACCTGAACNLVTKSACAGPFNGTPSNIVGTCEALTCVTTTGMDPCTIENGCSCDSKGKRTVGYIGMGVAPTCNCNTLTPYAYNGGCRWYYCQVCDSATGLCVNGCPAPRVCCEGTCCPIHQRCSSGACVDKCSSGTTFCAGTGSAYDCCAAGEKCCGPDGCLPLATGTASADFTIPLGGNAWISTGLTVPAGATVTITAGGDASVINRPAGVYGADREVLAFEVSPNGLGSRCRMYPECDAGLPVCHMRLIGKVGGTLFDVGSSYTGTPGAGLLQLRQNNTCTALDSGVYEGTASYSGLDPCPGYTPAAVGEPIVYGSGEKPAEPTPGPGAALKALLKLVGIVASPTCSCNARAAQMDSWGEWECLKHLPEICGWLKEEAEKRGLWFFPPAGMALILAAIALSALKRPFRGNSK